MSRKTSAVAGGNTGTIDQYNNLRDEAEASSRLLARQQASPDLTLYVSEGSCYINSVRIDFAGGNSPSFTAPASNPRIDCLSLNSSGVLVRTAGTENASPTAPALPADSLPICLVYNKVGQTSIKTVSDGTNGYIQVDTRKFQSKESVETYVTTSAGSADSGKVPKLNASGKLDNSFLSLFSNQEIPLATGTLTSADGVKITSNTDGSVLFVAHDGAGSSATIYRLERDPLTFQYYVTHSTTLSGNSPLIGGMAVIGSYLYVNCYISVASFRRYNIADLSGVTTMSFTSGVLGMTFGDQSGNLYVMDGQYGTYIKIKKYSISGTTLTYQSVADYYGAWYDTLLGDGTYVYSFYNTSNLLNKNAIAGGASVASKTLKFTSLAMLNGGKPQLFFAGNGLLGVAWGFNYVSATAVVGVGIKITAISTI